MTTTRTEPPAGRHVRRLEQLHKRGATLPAYAGEFGTDIQNLPEERLLERNVSERVIRMFDVATRVLGLDAVTRDALFFGLGACSCAPLRYAVSSAICVVLDGNGRPHGARRTAPPGQLPTTTPGWLGRGSRCRCRLRPGSPGAGWRRGQVLRRGRILRVGRRVGAAGARGRPGGVALVVGGAHPDLVGRVRGQPGHGRRGGGDVLRPVRPVAAGALAVLQVVAGDGGLAGVGRRGSAHVQAVGRTRLRVHRRRRRGRRRLGHESCRARHFPPRRSRRSPTACRCGAPIRVPARRRCGGRRSQR